MRRIRRMHLIRRPCLRKQHPARRTRLVRTQRLDPRLSLVLKARLVRRLLPDRRLNPIPRVPPGRRNRLIPKNGHPSSEPTASTRRLVAPGYEPRIWGQARHSTISEVDPTLFQYRIYIKLITAPDRASLLGPGFLLAKATLPVAARYGNDGSAFNLRDAEVPAEMEEVERTDRS